MKYFVVGDIHGSSTQLGVLLEQRRLYLDRQIIFLGDYVDIGPESAKVLDRLVDFGLINKGAIFLQGNHDFALASYLKSGDFVTYAQLGGTATIRAYCGEVRGDVHAQLQNAIPRTHREFLQNLQTHFETSGYLFSHCGYAPEAPLSRSRETMVLRSHQKLFVAPPSLSKVAVCGHYFQPTLNPFISEKVICLDTGCSILNGPLTAVLLPERLLVQIGADLSVNAP
jgi:serine/threonine protein phosphatase 1